MSEPARLQQIFARLEPLIVDDPRAQETQQHIAAAHALQARTERAARLKRERVALEPTMERAIVHGLPLDETASMLTVQRWLAKPDVPPVLVLRGGTGCGKSVAAAWAFANGPATGMWRSASEIVRIFVAYFGEDRADQTLLKQCALLVIDDIATETDAERMSLALVELLEQRKRHATRTRTIITTNLSDALFQQLYRDVRLLSRLGKIAVFVTDSGPDLRRRP